MLPFNPSFRRLVLRNIPQLTSEDLDQHESLIALRHHEIQEINIVPEPDEPDISVNPTSHDYGSVTIGSSKSQTFVVKNEGTADLEVSKTTLTGADKDQFNIDSDGEPFTVKPGENHELVISFNPTSDGSKNAVFEIESNDPAPDEANLLVFLTGTGVTAQVPDIAVEPDQHDYGEVVVENSKSQTFVVKNEGTANLVADKPEITGLNKDQFLIESGGKAFTLAQGQTHEVKVKFSPTIQDDLEATLRILSNDPDENPFEVSLKGMGFFVVDINAVKSQQANGKLSFRECLIEDATEEANAIFAPYKEVYAATVKLYNARRRVALAGGNFLQIPGTFKGFIALVVAILSYRWLQIETFPTLAANRIRYFFEEFSYAKLAYIVAGGFLISMGLLSLTPVTPESGTGQPGIVPPDTTITIPRPFTMSTITVPSASVAKQPFTTFTFKVSMDSAYSEADSSYTIMVPFDTTNAIGNTIFSIIISTKQDVITAK